MTSGQKERATWSRGLWAVVSGSGGAGQVRTFPFHFSASFHSLLCLNPDLEGEVPHRGRDMGSRWEVTGEREAASSRSSVVSDRWGRGQD